MIDFYSRKAMVHEFQFSVEEMRQFGLESEQYEYMENEARKAIKERGFMHIGGETHFWLSYDERPSTLTIII